MFENFSDIIRANAVKSAEKIFCIEYPGGRKTKYFEFDEMVNKCCHMFEELKIRQGEIISLCISNSLAQIVLYFSCQRSGIIVNTLPSSMSDFEIRKIILSINTKFLILDEKRKFNDQIEFENILYIDDDQTRFFDEIDNFSNSDYQRNIPNENIACIYATSGTTDNPKNILYSHRNMVSLISSMTRSFKFNNSDVHLGVLPLGHTAIINYSLLPTVYNGSTLILCKKFMDVRPQLFELIYDYRITYFQIVPTILFAILNTPYSEKSIKKVKSLKYIGCGSAPLPLELQKEFIRRFNIPVANLYGLSETGPSHFDDPMQNGWEPGSIGIPIDANECIILSEEGNKVKKGEIGEIALRGDNVFVGYHKNEKEYNKAIHKGFFLTGDLGFLGKDEKYYFIDRIKDLIIKGGVNIFPGEIEEVIYQIEGVQTVSVIGVPNEYLGEEINVYIILNDKTITEQLVKRHCDNNLQPIKRPDKIYIVDELPISHSGKILKKNLRNGRSNG